jgi:uncharacterized protein
VSSHQTSSQDNTVPACGFRLHLEQYIRDQARPVEKFGHQPRLYRLAGRIGQGLRYDDDVLFAAAWLHDLGVFLGHRPESPEALAAWDNVRYATECAPRVLHGFGFPSEKIPAVVEAIRTHQPSANPETIEGVILRDADILEQLGSIGVLRVVAKVGRDTRYGTFTDAVRTLHKALAELPGQLRLESAREMAKPRITILESFLSELDEEAPNDLF